jgi:hypothetical protein
VYIGNNYIKERIYSFPTFQYRLLKSFYHLKRISSFYAVVRMNQSLRKSWKNSHYSYKYPSSPVSNRPSDVLEPDDNASWHILNGKR